MNLNQYPKKIATLEKKILKINQNIQSDSDFLNYFNIDIEVAIAKNTELKNEQQRKAYRLEAQSSPDYINVSRNLKELKDSRDLLVIELNLLKNQFSVAKLETKLQIVSLESVA